MSFETTSMFNSRPHYALGVTRGAFGWRGFLDIRVWLPGLIGKAANVRYVRCICCQIRRKKTPELSTDHIINVTAASTFVGHRVARALSRTSYNVFRPSSGLDPRSMLMDRVMTLSMSGWLQKNELGVYYLGAVSECALVLMVILCYLVLHCIQWYM